MTNGQPPIESGAIQEPSRPTPDGKPQAERIVARERKIPSKATVNAPDLILNEPDLFMFPTEEEDRHHGAVINAARTKLLVNDVLAWSLAYFPDGRLKLRGSGVKKAATDALAPEYADQSPGGYENWYQRVSLRSDAVVKRDIFREYHDTLDELPPAVREPFDHILVSGSDLDIQINQPEKPDMQGEDIPRQFSRDIFTTLLPSLSEAIANNNYLTHPATTMGTLQQSAAQRRLHPELPVEALSSDNLPVPLINDVEEGVFIQEIPNRKISIITGEPEPSGKTPREFPSTVVYARRHLVRDKNITVTEIVIAADTRLDRSIPLTADTIANLTHAVASLSFNTTLPEEDMIRYDSRTSSAATSRDRVQASLQVVQPENAHRQKGQQEAAPQVVVTVDQDGLKAFASPVTLGPDWGKEEKGRDPIDDLELATRLLWQSVYADVFEQNKQHPVESITNETLGKIKTFIESHPDFITRLGRNEDAFRRQWIQENLLIMMIHNPHKTIDLLDASGFARLIFPTDTQDSLLKIRQKLGEISPEDYRVQFFGKFSHPETARLAQVHPPIYTLQQFLDRDIASIGQYNPEIAAIVEADYRQQERVLNLPRRDGWQLINEAIAGPDGPTDRKTVLTNLYNLTNIGYNSPHA
ncbi:MAG TPA: hypothetical protein VEW42_01805 [Candidatus Eisenbacteria bacterium]|nr:hypothetical protein [Candidatus Eisenbacteria bacterium]